MRVVFARKKCGAHDSALRWKNGGVIYLIVSSSSPALTV